MGYPFRVRDRDGYGLLATSALMTGASAVRAGVACMELWSQRVPPLVKLAADLGEHASEDAGAGKGRLRDELIAVARESADVILNELHRGVEDLDSFTRPDEQPAEHPSRRYRAKP